MDTKNIKKLETIMRRFFGNKFAEITIHDIIDKSNKYIHAFVVMGTLKEPSIFGNSGTAIAFYIDRFNFIMRTLPVDSFDKQHEEFMQFAKYVSNTPISELKEDPNCLGIFDVL